MIGGMAHFIVDGYNVIRQSDLFSGGPLRAQRERFLRWIEDRNPQGSSANVVTVVFDGRSDVFSPTWPGPTRVIYSCGQDADGAIKDLVDRLSNPSQAVVVTDDREIQRWVRAVKAQVLGSGAFLLAGASPTVRRSAVVLDASDVEAINDELRTLWKLK